MTVCFKYWKIGRLYRYIMLQFLIDIIKHTDKQLVILLYYVHSLNIDSLKYEVNKRVIFKIDE